ncbi:MAG: hypothetical protein BAA04_00040 [Firmicutes bacterium ZCTH02-B6]|nr:MAG: hypothetical protein BAA04_00040 [Firmicutes bacterium ZCTH02-B6]
MILTMLQEGKITAEEAAELLEALSRTDETHKEKTVSDRVAEVVERVEQAREQVEEKLQAARQRIEEARVRGERTGEEIIQGLEDVFVNVERGLSRVLGELPDTVGRWFGVFRLWPEHTVNQVYEGDFPAGLSEVDISVATRDGFIRIEGGDGPGYRVEVINHVRVDDADLAAKLAAEATRWEVTERGFRLVAADRRDVEASVKVVLPKGLSYRLECQTADGSVRCRSVQLTKARLTTADGSIRLNGVEVEELEATTADGSIRVSGAVARARCSTADGSIEARYVPARPDAAGTVQWDLRTSDGRIRVSLPSGDDVGYQLDLETADGRVRAMIPGVEQRVAGRHTLRAETPGFDEKRLRFTVRARTADGSILVGHDVVQDTDVNVE